MNRATLLQLIENYRWNCEALAFRALASACGEKIDEALMLKIEQARWAQIAQLSRLAAIDEQPVLEAAKQIFFGEGEGGQ